MRKLFNMGFTAATVHGGVTHSSKETLGWRLLRTIRPTGRAIKPAYHVRYKKSMSTTASTTAATPYPERPTPDPDMKPISALFLLFPNFNTLDLNGPLETLAQANGYTSFNNTIASATPLTTAAESLTVQRHISFSDALTSLSEYDVLVVPGAPNNHVLTAIDNQPEMLNIITKYSKLTTPGKTPSDLNINTKETSKSKERILMSVCTGAGFLGATGVLAGKKATTHWGFLDILGDITGNYTKAHKGSKATEVVKARFVDAGLNSNGVRIITAAGVSSGIDAALYLASKKCGNDTANFSAHIMDYNWRLGEGMIVDAGSQPKY